MIVCLPIIGDWSWKHCDVSFWNIKTIENFYSNTNRLASDYWVYRFEGKACSCWRNRASIYNLFKVIGLACKQGNGYSLPVESPDNSGHLKRHHKYFRLNNNCPRTRNQCWKCFQSHLTQYRSQPRIPLLIRNIYLLFFKHQITFFSLKMQCFAYFLNELGWLIDCCDRWFFCLYVWMFCTFRRRYCWSDINESWENHAWISNIFELWLGVEKNIDKQSVSRKNRGDVQLKERRVGIVDNCTAVHIRCRWECGDCNRILKDDACRWDHFREGDDNLINRICVKSCTEFKDVWVRRAVCMCIDNWSLQLIAFCFVDRCVDSW